MHPIESLEMAKNIVQQLIDKPEPLVKQIAPSPGSRAERYVQLLCPELHEIVEAAERSPAAEGSEPASSGPGAAVTLGQRVFQLEEEVAMLRTALARLAAEIGASDPFPSKKDETPSKPPSSGHTP
jgi:uncharacterized protein YceH (UPF0502 family)